MKYFCAVLFNLLCVVSWSYGLDDATENRIIGGSPAKRNQFPYMVSIQYFANHLCGGAIISPKLVVSAAHCFVDDIETYYLRVVAGLLHQGEHHRDIQTILVRQVVHPGYFPSRPLNDLAILVLASPFTFNKAVQPVNLPTQHEEHDGEVTVSGWGRINFDPRIAATTLQYSEMPIISNEECNNIFAKNSHPQAFKYLVKDTMLCTLPPEDQSACKGDSGGPLVKDGVLVGIVHGGHDGCLEGSPNVFTKVSAYRNYIDYVQNIVEK